MTRKMTPMCGVYSQSSSGELSQLLPCSQGSLWGSQSPQPQRQCRVQTKLEQFRDLFNVFRTEKAMNIIPEWHVTDAYTTLSQRSKRQYQSISRRVCKAVNFALVGDEEEKLSQDLALQDRDWNRGQQVLQEVLKTTKEILPYLPTTQERRMVIGSLALHIPYRVISSEIEGLTEYAFTKSRQLIRYYAWQHAAPPHPPKTRQEKSRQAIRIFLQYILDNTIPLPFGVKLKNLPSGRKIELQTHLSYLKKKSLIIAFTEYMMQTIQQEYILSQSTYFKILQQLNLKFRHSLHGLDYITNGGLECFDKIEHILERLIALNRIDDNEKKELSKQFTEARNYLRGDYRYHVALTSTVADHCRQYGVSDPQEEKLQQQCDHEHRQLCQQCQSVKNQLADIQTLVSELPIPSEREKDLIKDDLRVCAQKIAEMKHHQMRSINQNQAKQDRIKSLQQNQALITGDFAMKFLPASSRETQVEFFRKKGISWHIFYVVRMNADKQLEYRVFQHVFKQQTKQDSTATVALLNDTLKRLAVEWPQLNEVFLCSDDAMNYHSALTLASAFALSKEGIRIRRWDFSEAQDGKGPCDQMASVVKRRIYAYLDEGQGREARNADQIAIAAHHNNGLHGVTTVTVGSLIMQQPPAHSQKLVIPNINKFYDFEFLDDYIRAWKAYGMGEGLLFPVPPSFHLSASVDKKDSTTYPLSSTPTFVSMAKTRETCFPVPPPEIPSRDPNPPLELPEQSCLRLFECPVPNCIKTFNKHGNLVRHMMIGNHKFYKGTVTIIDYALKTFQNFAYDQEVQQEFERIPSTIFRYDEEEVSGYTEQMGFALQQRAVRKTILQDVKQFLTDKFLEGEHTRKKFNARTVAEMMRTAVDQSGKPRFSPENCLTWQQIASFWSQYARKKRHEISTEKKESAEKENSVDADDYQNDVNIGNEHELIEEEVNKEMPQSRAQ